MVEIKGTTLQIGKEVFLKIYGAEAFAQLVGLLSPEEQEVFNAPIWSVYSAVQSGLFGGLKEESACLM